LGTLPPWGLRTFVRHHKVTAKDLPDVRLSLSLSHSLHESSSALGVEEELEGEEKEEEEKRLKRLWIRL
jgi:hypothetical protein